MRAHLRPESRRSTNVGSLLFPWDVKNRVATGKAPWPSNGARRWHEKCLRQGMCVSVALVRAVKDDESGTVTLTPVAANGPLVGYSQVFGSVQDFSDALLAVHLPGDVERVIHGLTEKGAVELAYGEICPPVKV